MKKLLLPLLLIPSLSFGQLIISGGAAGGGGDAVTTNPLSQFAATTSLQLKGVISDETGSGAAVFATSPTFVTPILGTPTSVTLTNGTGLPASGIGSGTIAQARLGTGSDGSGTHFLADDQTYKSAAGAGDALTTDPLSQFAATTSLQLKGVLSDETGSGLAVFATSPTLTTPILGTPTSGTLTNCTGLPLTGITGDTGTALGVGAINLGHATDTSLTRASAGVMQVEGVTVLLSGAALGTPSSGTLTNATGLPIAGLTASTSTALGVGSVELGHASDTTIARSGAGAITVEGTAVLLSGGALGTPSSATLTNATGLPVAGITASTSTALGVGTVELGAASDTTLARSGAGAITVEGTAVLLSGGALGTPSSGTLTNATGLPIAGLTASTSTALGVGSVELGAASDTTIARSGAGAITVEGVAVPTTTSTSTLTNKRVNPRTDSTASTASLTIDSDAVDEYTVTALAAAMTINAPSGTPVEGQKLLIRIKDNATARALSFSTGSSGQFRASSDLALPTTTTLSKTLYTMFVYNATDSRWDLLAKLDNF